MNATLEAEAVERAREAVLGHERVLPRGGGTKPALSSPPDGTATIDVSEIAGIVDYDPEELTFTAGAGTPVRDVADALAEHGQYLPFDPPFADRGATLGGVVAAGTSGPLRYRNGGVRDFVIGVAFLDGRGRMVRGGGRVVKNAAGLDFPKLMVGSAGRLGVILELSFKVFPKPRAWSTIGLDCAGLDDALEVIGRLATAPFDLEGLDLQPPGRLLLRLAGAPDAMPARAERLERFLERQGERLEGDDEETLWRDARDFEWAPEGSALVKVGLVARRIPALEAVLEAAGATRRYCSGGNLGLIAWPQGRSIEELDRALSAQDLAAVVLAGSEADATVDALVGAHRGGAFARRVKAALDPDGRFPEV